MSERVKSKAKKPFMVNLDGEIVTLPGKSLESMLGMFAHLESLALRRAKSAPPSPGGGSGSSRGPALPKFQAFEEARLGRISFRELGRQVIRAARGQLRV